jgi:O-antigen/teichoic acid export membrane protein
MKRSEGGRIFFWFFSLWLGQRKEQQEDMSTQKSYTLRRMREIKAKTLSLLRVPFVQNVMRFQVSNMGMLVTGAISSVLYARLLGVEQFGLFTMISAFAGLLCLAATFGQETTVVTFLSEAVGRGSRKDTTTVISYFVQSALLALLIYTTLFILSPLLSTLFRGNEDLGYYARWLILNSALQSTPALVFTILQIENRITLIAILENVRAIAQVVISTVLLLLHFGVWSLIIGTVSVSIAYIPICVWLYWRYAGPDRFPTVRELGKSIRQRGTGMYFRQGLWIAADQMIASNLYPNLFYMILGATAPLQIVGLFRLGMRLATIPVQIIMPSVSRLAAVAIPKIASLNRKTLRNACFKLMKGTVLLGALATVGAAIVATPLIPIVYGRAFAGAIPAFLIILPFTIISTGNVAIVPIARIFKRVWLLTLTNAAGLLCATAAYFLLKTYVSPLVAISISVLVYHMNTLFLSYYLWTSILHDSEAHHQPFGQVTA